MEMKQIDYRGGVVTFRIPVHWKEEYEPDGGGTFYAEGPDTGTLRLNVLSARAPSGSRVTCGYDHLQESSAHLLGKIIHLPSGDGMQSYSSTGEESGFALVLQHWDIAHWIPPRSLCLAMFSWTVLAARADTPENQEEVAMLASELSRIRFHPNLE
jgi:hypothetical protein